MALLAEDSTTCDEVVIKPKLGRVLVIDDESAIVNVETEVLRLAGYEAVGITRGRDALNRDATAFDVVITDYRMPDLDGLTLFSRLRQENPHLVGVLVTGYGSLKLVQTAMRAGFNAILLKPFPLERLTMAVERALRQQRLAEENFRLGAILDVYATGQDLNRPRSRSELAMLLSGMARDSVEAAAAGVLLAEPPDLLLRRPFGPDAPHFPAWADALLGLDAAQAEREVWAYSGHNSRLALPLRFGPQTEGLLLVEKEPQFGPLEVERLALLANQGALALSYLRLFEERLLGEKLALVGRLAGAIAGRVRRPVEVIRDVAQQLPADEGDYRQMIVENAHRLEEMCGEFTDFMADTSVLEPVDTALAAWLHELARQYHAAMRARQVTVHVVAPVEPRVAIDRRIMARAVWNLLKNAADAMPEGGEVAITLKTVPGYAVIEVSDSGCGMPPEVLSRVFEPFYTHGKQGGTGLGGAVVRSAVTAHGGQAEAESQVGLGTTFRLFLPLAAGRLVGGPS